MFKRTIMAVFVSLWMVGISLGQDAATINHLVKSAVLVQTNSGSGSGAIVVREVEGHKVAWVISAGHVVSSLRSTRPVIAPDGSTKTLIEFKDAVVVMEFFSNGRKTGVGNFDAKILKYSPINTGQDIAIMEIRQKDVFTEGVNFYLGEEIQGVGTEVLNVGSIHGVIGQNSFSKGSISYVGRVIEGAVYDASSCVALPGSSGSLIALSNGEYYGMITLGISDSVNMFVPFRRIKKYLNENNMAWIYDPAIVVPTEVEREKIFVE